MKLVEILARELGEWPEGFDNVGQADDGSLHLPGIGQHVRHTRECYTRSEDWITAIVTRAQWQSERDRIAKEKTSVKPKANKDGWIRHRGGKCPVANDVRVSYRLRHGSIFEKSECAGDLRWDHRNTPGDIMAWKPHVSSYIEPMIEEGIQAADEGKTTPIGVVIAKWRERQAEMPAAKYFDGPIQWRDRILSIDTERQVEEARHCAAMDALDAERAELVAKLKAEGLALCERDCEKVDVDPECDMSDWRNWRKGDFVTFIGESDNCFTTGKIYTVSSINPKSSNQVSIDSDDEGDNNGWCARFFKWHSRPTP